jgi:L-seryl-tRNA(Ser) seleniumtransferase
MTEVSRTHLRRIPSVERVLKFFHDKRAFPDVDRAAVRDAVRETLAGLREHGARVETETDPDYLLAGIERAVAERLAGRPGLRAVINATGVVLHTNLGRAPLPAAAIAAIGEIGRGYSNLEYDLAAGKRGKRDVHCESLLCDLLGAEAAVVVNNCAAAVFLILDTLGNGGEAVISRGELVEIGGGFRIPDVMRKSGVGLREVGTTNRTRLADYETAIGPETKMIVRVHPSNFRLLGFAERPAVADLAALAKARGLVFFEDIGSGAIEDLSAQGLNDEPFAVRSLADGADIVAFSGDKLLGGPQAGIIAGRQELVDRVRRNPLMRMLRVDKLVYAALEATLRLYRNRAFADIPALAMLRQSPVDTKTRAERFARKLRRAFGGEAVGMDITLRRGDSLVGGGSAPHVKLPTTLVALKVDGFSPEDLEARLRRAETPVIARIEDGRVVLDLRTVLPEQEDRLATEVLRSISR